MLSGCEKITSAAANLEETKEEEEERGERERERERREEVQRGSPVADRVSTYHPYVFLTEVPHDSVMPVVNLTPFRVEGVTNAYRLAISVRVSKPHLHQLELAKRLVLGLVSGLHKVECAISEDDVAQQTDLRVLWVLHCLSKMAYKT